ncbi:hypothetical protein SKAU_G00257000 [Synaphobranchus kaupii]|uniref:Uncharacterized protein n=1 Tax=Synaphobranchus kaupii TaxID=118154 RepID=A0A9Q1ISF3_SYNKA|nr:hypothetical protein SKAU_G00257000 [Synaphobranchus kaupii]
MGKSRLRSRQPYSSARRLAQTPQKTRTGLSPKARVGHLALNKRGRKGRSRGVFAVSPQKSEAILLCTFSPGATKVTNVTTAQPYTLRTAWISAQIARPCRM